MDDPLAVCSCDPDKHSWIESYYGWKCSICGDFVPFGCEPWAYIDDAPNPDEFVYNLSPGDSQPVMVNVTRVEQGSFYFIDDDEPEPPEPDETDLWTDEDE